jgi:AraC-like DNA-binding protein
MLTSAAHPIDVIIGTTSRPISLRLPRAILEARIADLDACIARRIPSNIKGLPLLISYVDAVRFTELTNPALCDLAVSHVYDLVALLLTKGDARHLAQQRGARAARRDAILRTIERRSGDPGLSVLTVALLLGVTPRYVHLLLEETGKIADIAAEAGFADLSYFNRAFRRRFGATPSDIRATTVRNG